MNDTPLSPEDLVEAFLAERRAGAQIDARTFLARYAGAGTSVLDALEAIESLEHASDGGMLPLTPGHVGPFRIVRELGRGGMGVVFQAIEEPLERRVALKLLPPELTASPAARSRFHREAALSSRLDHSGICTIYGAGVLDGQPWIAMRCVEGETLGRRIASAHASGKLRLPGPSELSAELGIAACVARIARALAHAHAQGIVHRDVKPSNVMVTPSGEPVLLDFGLAFEPESTAATLTRTGEVVGTPAYLAPELLTGEASRSDERCDVYSLGVTLYECLALAPPFRGATREALYRAVMSGDAADVRTLNPDVPRDLAVVVATALERDRRARYASAEQLALDLEAVVAHRPISARSVGAFGRLARWSRREPRQAVLAAALAISALAVALVGGAWLASRDKVRLGERIERAQAIERALFDGYVALGERRRDAALRSFEAVLALDATNEEAQVGRVVALLRQKRIAEARAIAGALPSAPAFDALRVFVDDRLAAPKDPNWWMRASAFELFLDGERCLSIAELSTSTDATEWNKQALTRFSEAVTRSPAARAHYHYIRAYAASGAGDADAARSAAAALLALWPESTTALEQAGAALIELDPAAAAPLLERALLTNETRAQSHQNLGLALMRLGDTEAARRHFQRALELSPNNVYALNGLSVTEKERGCAAEQRAALDAAHALDPASVPVLSNLAELACEENNLELAAELLGRLLELDPALTNHRAVRGFVLADLGDVERAVDEFGIALAYAPRDPLAWLRYGSMLLVAGDAERTLECVSVARELDRSIDGIDQLEDQARTALSQR